MIERTNAPGLSQPPGYSHVVIASGRRLVTTAGAVPLDAEGNLVGAGDLLVQARQTLENLVLALEAVGATAQDVTKITVYVVAGERADLGVCVECGATIGYSWGGEHAVGSVHARRRGATRRDRGHRRARVVLLKW
jgi:enamine deaminase RidA (YjgF/YER057c/UK114 family)